MNAVILFLEALAKLAELRNGGRANDITKLLTYGSTAMRLTTEAKGALEGATAKVQQLVDEDRQLTPEENAAIDASIQQKLDAIANTTIKDAPNDAPQDPAP